jgi:hypothetical protein
LEIGRKGVFGEVFSILIVFVGFLRGFLDILFGLFGGSGIGVVAELYSGGRFQGRNSFLGSFWGVLMLNGE